MLLIIFSQTSNNLKGHILGFILSLNIYWTGIVKQTTVLEDKRRGSTRRRREKRIANCRATLFMFFFL